MSYQVLARKWRPTSFEQVIGQQHVLQALINALDQQRLHHAYLFTGTRGIGKTSIARLLAKALNCEQRVSSHPCGQCQSCLEIEQGNFIDLIEVDAASKTKVEDTRDILDNVQYKPTRGRYKVYLIDEVHMLSRSSFNALLKTLEEPPEHVKFLFATTEAQKLPITILSRCLQFNLKVITAPQIAQQLAHILDAEHVSYDNASLNLIADAATGSMRDALSLTDQAIAFGNGSLAQTGVGKMLGTLDVNHSAELLMLAAKGQGELLLNKSAQLIEYAPDYDNLLKQMAKDVHLSALSQVVKSSARSANEPKSIVELASVVAPEMLQLFYHILLQGRKELEFAPDAQSGFEMVLLRLLAFVPNEIATDAINQQTAPETELKILDDQQNNILAQAGVLTTSIPQPEIEKKLAPKIPAASESLTKVAPGDISQPTNSKKEISEQQFTDQELMNMSYANASDDIEHNEPYLTQGSVASVAKEPAAAIDDFVNARNALRRQLNKGQDASGKKPEAVKVTLTPRAKPSSTAERSLPHTTTDIAVDSSLEQRYPNKQCGDTLSASEMPAFTSNVKIADSKALVAVDDVVDPASLLVPNTKDPWSVMIDAMAIGGRLRLLATQSSYRNEQQNVVLLLRPEHRHLLAPNALEQLQQHIRQYLNQQITLTIDIGSDEQLTPDQIATNLHQQRLASAIECIESDSFINQFRQQFGAEINIDSINYRSLNKVS